MQSSACVEKAEAGRGGLITAVAHIGFVTNNRTSKVLSFEAVPRKDATCILRDSPDPENQPMNRMVILLQDEIPVKSYAISQDSLKLIATEVMLLSTCSSTDRRYGIDSEIAAVNFVQDLMRVEEQFGRRTYTSEQVNGLPERTGEPPMDSLRRVARDAMFVDPSQQSLTNQEVLLQKELVNQCCLRYLQGFIDIPDSVTLRGFSDIPEEKSESESECRRILPALASACTRSSSARRRRRVAVTRTGLSTVLEEISVQDEKSGCDEDTLEDTFENYTLDYMDTLESDDDDYFLYESDNSEDES